MPSQWVIYVATAIACEVALHLPFRQTIETMLGTLQRSMRVIVSKRISDHWKETVLPVYSIRLFKASILFLALIAVFLMPFAAGGFLFLGGIKDLVAAMSEWPVIAIMTALACVYLWLRVKFRHG